MAFRLPAGTRLGPVHLQVSRVERSVAYYRDVLGLRAASEEDGRVTLSPHDDDRPLVVLIERADARPVRPQSVLGLYHFAILLPDRAALGRFLSHVGAIGGRVGMSDHAVSESVYLSDPDGLGIEVYADRPRSAWRRDESGQLHMTTAPLDVRSVIASAHGAPWSGTPAGTVMGHVHLHVGNLERASEFYSAGLGLDPTLWSYPGALFLAAGGYHHHLGTNTWVNGPSAAEDQARLLFWNVVVPTTADVRGVAASLGQVSDLEDQSEASVSAVDPWGTRVTVSAEG